MYYPIDPDPEALSAGAAITLMLESDPRFSCSNETPPPDDSLPLFLDPDTGVELTYQHAFQYLRSLWVSIGETDLEIGRLSIRICDPLAYSSFCPTM